MASERKLAGQVAIVTGGGRGIGRAVAQCLAEAGVAVAVAGRSLDHLTETARLIEDAGARALALETDVTDRQSVEALVQATRERLGPVDLLVNNAGNLTVAPIWEADPDEWWHCIDVNLRGPFLCTRAVLPSMISRGRGCIVNVASNAAYTDPPYLSAYGSSKAALIRFTRSLAAETRAHGLVAFAVHPGGVDTELQRQYQAQLASLEGQPRQASTPYVNTSRRSELAVSSKSWHRAGQIASPGVQ